MLFGHYYINYILLIFCKWIFKRYIYKICFYKYNIIFSNKLIDANIHFLCKIIFIYNKKVYYLRQ